jgi:hypothetical protein
MTLATLYLRFECGTNKIFSLKESKLLQRFPKRIGAKMVKINAFVDLNATHTSCIKHAQVYV